MPKQNSKQSKAAKSPYKEWKDDPYYESNSFEPYPESYHYYDEYYEQDYSY